MSLGNSNLHQKGEIPEIIKLPNNRIRVIRRFHKFTREDIDNSSLGSLMGDFGALDTADEQITGQGYTNCRLISVEVDNRFNQQANADNPVLVKTYETLTSSFVEINDPTVEILENGIKKITKVYRAISGASNPNTIGTTTISGTGEILATSKIEDNTAFAELTETYLKPNVVLNVSEDKVGSQLAVTNEVFKPSNESNYSGVNASGTALTSYVEANREKSSFDGIPTVKFTFLKPNVTLSQSIDKLGSLEVSIIEVFKPSTDPHTLSDFTEVKREESDVDGIKTQKITFYKDNAIISHTFDKVGSQKSVIISKFKAEPTTSEASSFASETIAEGGSSSYLIAKKEEEGKAGAEIYTYTFLKNNAVISESEDKVGSQKAIVREIFGNNISNPTDSDYDIARTEESEVDGIPTKKFTLLKPNVVLSQQTDMLGSLEVTITETFSPSFEGGATLPTLSNFTLVKTEESDVDGIKTQRATFYKNDAIISQSVDLVGSESAIIIKKFLTAPTIAEALSFSSVTGSGSNPFSIAKKEEEGKTGAKIYTYTFLQKSILSISQVFDDGLNKFAVEAYNMTEAEVDTELDEVTENHLLISQADTNRDGIKTTTFEYQLDSSLVEDYELNGLKRITLTELSSSNFTAQTIGEKETAGEGGTATVYDGLYLSTQEIDNGGTVKVRESVWVEGGQLTTKKVNEGEGIYEVTNVFLGEIPTEDEATGPIVSLEEDNIGGLKTITQVELQDSNGGSIVTTEESSEGSTTPSPISSVGTLYSFTYPGLVEIDTETLTGDGSTYNFTSRDIKLTPPCTANIEATKKTFFKTDTTVSYSSTDGLWSPKEWAVSESKGIGWYYAPFYISQGYRGYRSKPAGGGYLQTQTGTGLNGDQVGNTWNMQSGKRIFAGTGWKISCTGGPEDPVGKNYTLDYTVELAFNDTSNEKYYKHTEIVATIPSQTTS